MDASDALNDLRSRFGQSTVDPLTVRRALAVFSEYAAEPVTFQGGSNDEDWVTISLDIVTSPEDWDIGVGPLTAGSAAITMDRNMYLADADGDFELCAQTGVVLVLAPNPGQGPAALAAAAPAGHCLLDPDPVDLGEGPSTNPGYVTTVEQLTENVLDQLADTADATVLHLQITGDVPDRSGAPAQVTAAPRPFPLPISQGLINESVAEDELERSLRSKTHPGPFANTERALNVMLELCARPISTDRDVVEDYLSVKLSGPFEMEPAPMRHALRLERRTTLASDADGEGPTATIGFTLRYLASTKLGPLPPFHRIMAPAASSPTAVVQPSRHTASLTDVVKSLDDVSRAVRNSPIAALLDLTAVGVELPSAL